MQPNPIDALIPWLIFAVVIGLLLRVQKAVQHRIFGLGWMFSARHEAAAVIYTIVLLPGILVHEFAEWLTAGVLGFKATQSMRWPEADKNGELDPKFITVEYPKLPKTANSAQKLKDLFGRAFVEITPTIVGIALTLLISNSILQLQTLTSEIPSWDVVKIGDAFGRVTSQPGFPLWFYILFTVSNAMMPRQFARRGIAILAGVAAAFMIVLAIIGFSGAVSTWLNGPIPAAVNQLSAIFALVLVVDSVVLVGLIAAEAVIERVTNRKAPYKTAAERALAMRSAAPKPAPKPITSIYEYLVPLPSIPDVMGIRVKAAPAPKPEMPKPEEKPAMPAPAPKPGIAAPIARPITPEPASRRELPEPDEKPALPAASPSGFGSPRSIPSQTPARPAVAASTSQPAEPAKPDEPAARPAFGSPKPATSPFGAPKPGSTPAATSANKPAEPQKPAAPAASGGSPFGARPGVPPPAARPGLPSGSTTANPPVPVGRPGVPAPPLPGAKPLASNPAQRNDDIIDAEVIDEDDDEPSFMKGVNRTNTPGTPPPSRPGSAFGSNRPSSPFSPPSKPFSAPQPKRDYDDDPDDDDEDREDDERQYTDVDDPA
jgi:hypothetical protein